MNKLDKDYQALLQDILDNGVTKQDRTGTGTKSIFGYTIRHNMKDGFPLLTTKKMPFKTIVTELLWFLRGDTNIKFLVDNGCNIWNGDAYKNYLDKKMFSSSFETLIENDEDGLLTQDEFIEKIKADLNFASGNGELGPIYGKQWRSWEGYKHGMVLGAGLSKEQPIDQIQNLIDDLKTNPDSRRLMVNAWNVGELDQMVLPPCHYGFQVYTRELSSDERYNLLSESEKKNFIIAMRPMMSPDDKYDEVHYTIDNYYKHIPKRAISLMWNQRSVDTFLGLPFNIASYGLLLEIIAKEVNMVPDELIGNLGDVHLYSNHIEQAKEQIGRELTEEELYEISPRLRELQHIKNAEVLAGNYEIAAAARKEELDILKGITVHTRQPFPLPTLKFNPCPITGISMEYLSIAQFEIENYQSHPTIKAPLSN